MHVCKKSPAQPSQETGNRHLFTSESVSMGHPDKVADQISDALLDAYLALDPEARVAIETMVTEDHVILAGEVRAEASIDYEAVVRRVVADIGYTEPEVGFEAGSLKVQNLVGEQSRDIARGVDTGGAGDQGMMFGFACDETPELMPLPIMLAHRLVERLARVRESGEVKGLRPDAKAQVTVCYDEGRPVAVDTVVVSSQHDERWTEDQAGLSRALVEQVIRPVLGDWWHDDISLHINPTGRFLEGGPKGDCGLTGRKIIVDTYGGRGRHGGGAFSGKDATKVDRSAAYMARYIAKNVVAAGLATTCELQLSYAIGCLEPVSVHVDCQGTLVPGVTPAALARAIGELFDLTPTGIIETLGLRAPIYEPSARHGHFGRAPYEQNGLHFFPWEKTDRAADLRKALMPLR
jgi:S-adenosylmethionine synthetase